MATVLKKQCMGVGRPTMLGNMEDIYDVIVDTRIKNVSNEDLYLCTSIKFGH